MKANLFPLQNRGMSRDLSVTKSDNTMAWENHNIRILARDHDTLLSVTNERGNKPVENLSFEGGLVGWNTLNNYLILFTVKDGVSHIYRVKYEAGAFSSIEIYSSEGLGFDLEHPIESITDFETEDIQKIYWIDGIHVLRFLNFSDTYLKKHLASGALNDSPVFDFAGHDDWFDSTKSSDVNMTVSITKDNGGQNRPNGVAQYFITYYDKNGHQTGIAWVSPLIYLSPEGRGGAADSTNSNRVVFTLSDLDADFDYVRLYQVVTTTYNKSRAAYLVAESAVSENGVTIVDDGTPLSTVDIYEILYLGSKQVYPGTMAQKDGTLFLGNLKISDKEDLTKLESTIYLKALGVSKIDGSVWQSKIVKFQKSSTTNLSSKASHIPYVKADGYYPYNSQLAYTNSQITTFKGGEKYRFALQFFTQDGTASKAYWIGDAVNNIYPIISGSGYIERSIAVCTLPSEVLVLAIKAGFTSVQLMIAQASYADRSVQAQGIVSPTMFNLYNRLNDAPYAQASWNYRIRGGNLAYQHFEPVHNSDSSSAEIQCNYWDSDMAQPNPLYLKGSDGEPVYKPMGYSAYTGIIFILKVHADDNLLGAKYWAEARALFYTGNAIDGWVQAFDTGTASFDKRQRGETALKSLIARVLNFCSDNGVPSDVCTEDIIRTAAASALSHCSFLQDVGHETYSVGDNSTDPVTPMPWNFRLRSVDSEYARLLREYYFVDEHIVTLNSPEIEYESVNLDSNSGLKFRIVGVAQMTSDIVDYDISAHDYDYNGDRVLRKQFSSPNVSTDVEGLSAWPLYLETGLEEDPDDGNPNEVTYKRLGTQFAYMTYMWHKTGSIPLAVANDEQDKVWSILDHKIFANLHYSYKTIYNPEADEWSWAVPDVRQFTALNSQLYNLSVDDEKKIYTANVNDLITVPAGVKYPVYFATSDTAADESISLQEPLIEAIDPVQLTYNSRSHIVFSLPTVYGGQTILPYMFDYERYAPLRSSDAGVTGPFAPWYKPTYQSIDTSDAVLIYRESGESSPSAWAVILDSLTLSLGKASGSAVMQPNSANAGAFERYLNAVSSLRKAGTTDSIYAVAKTENGDPYLVDLHSTKNNRSAMRITYSAKPGGNIVPTALSPSINHDDDADSNTTTTPTTYHYVVSLWLASLSASVDSINYTISTITGDVCRESSVTNPDEKVDISFWLPSSDGEKLTSLVVTYTVHYSDSAFSDWTETLTVPVTGGATAANDYEVIVSGASYISLLGATQDFNVINVYDNYVYTYDVSDDEFQLLTQYSGEGIYVDPIQRPYILPSGKELNEGDKYVFIGELYFDYDSDPDNDPRYGGNDESSIEANTFIKASDRINIRSLGAAHRQLIGNEGDTYFQRWDSMKTYPRSSTDENQVIDIASVMLETHINIDGRTDLDRGISKLASIDYTNFGALNNVYSQEDNFGAAYNTDESLNLDSYRSSITWTLEKKDNAEVDEWTHITLGTSLKLDGDKGPLQALRRFQNSIIAFQDRGISEVLFNSRTQVSTTEGVPIEIANSGKVDGKRYITNKYGCKNKWSIVEGKGGMYFVDDTNKALLSFSGQGIDNLSGKARFDAWVREHSSNNTWDPKNFDNFVSYYDRIHSDVYFVGSDSEQPCLVYNEVLGSFTSFFDYSKVPMMTNLDDKFMSFYNDKLWLQNEGEYNNIYGTPRDFWMTYRATPDPYSDKIWTDFEYRADFFDADVAKESIVDGYMPDETFTYVKFWDEYQTTEPMAMKKTWLAEKYPDVRKTFRIWRSDIPRAKKNGSNKYGLDRMRNPWIFMKLLKTGSESNHMMQLHDIVIKYFTNE